MSDNYDIPNDYVYIYGLRREGAKMLRYIGQSCIFEGRRNDHWYAEKYEKSSKKNIWIRRIKAEKKKLEIVKIGACPREVADEVERAIIRGMHKAGYPILNTVLYIKAKRARNSPTRKTSPPPI